MLGMNGHLIPGDIFNKVLALYKENNGCIFSGE